jgi:ketosteroid isomerase-like protein
MDDKSITAAFNDAINRRDLAALGRLMTADHRFVDTEGRIVAGKLACLVAWRQFFDAFPDYRNVFEHVGTDGDVVLVIGRSECAEPLLAGPAQWRVRVDGSSVVEWRVFDVVDNG